MCQRLEWSPLAVRGDETEKRFTRYHFADTAVSGESAARLISTTAESSFSGLRFMARAVASNPSYPLPFEKSESLDDLLELIMMRI